MADTKISGLAAVTDVQDTDEYVLARTGATKKITGANLKAGMPSGASGPAGGVLAGTYPNPGFAADMATQAELDAHTADTTAAHAASAVSFTPTGTVAATDVQAAIAEVAAEAVAASGIPPTIVDAKGDLIAASAADTVARLPVGSNDQVLVADSGQTLGLKWAAVPGTGAFVPVSTIDAKGDLLVGTGNDALDNLPLGSNGQILTAEPSLSMGVKWADPVGIPKTTVDAKGDLLVASADDAVGRLPVGTNGHVLTVDSAQTLGLKWAAAAAPTGGLTKLFDSTLGSPAASIDTGAGGIVGGYVVLDIVMYLRNSTGFNAALDLRFNADASAAYDYIRQYATGSTSSSGQTLAQTGVLIYAPGSGAAAGTFSAWRLTIPNYDGTTYRKTITGSGGAGDTTTNNGASIMNIAGTWRNTAAITRLSIHATSGSIDTGSRLVIWGLS